MEFSAPVTFETPVGNLTFNGATDSYFLTNVEGLDGPELRTPTDHRSRRDGGIPYQFYRGYSYPHIQGYFKAASVSARNTLEDTLKGYVGACLRQDGRWRWTLTGKTERFIAVKQYLPVTIAQMDGIVHSFEFGLISTRHPYAGTFTETDTSISAGGSANITNAGTAPWYPIIEVNGATTACTITNNTTGKKIQIDGAGFSIAGGHFGEIDCFNQTFYLDGNSSNLLGYINMAQSYFFPLEPGVNNISVTGASIMVKSNDGWL